MSRRPLVSGLSALLLLGSFAVGNASAAAPPGSAAVPQASSRISSQTASQAASQAAKVPDGATQEPTAAERTVRERAVPGSQRTVRASSDVLDRARRGPDAVARLGSEGLRTAAIRNRTTPSALAAHLREDPTLWLDAEGHLLVKDTGLTDPAERNAPDVTSGSARARAATTSQVVSAFSLHSRSGSSRVIYLDFDGQRVVGTGWNDETNGDDFTVEPFDTDGSPSTFSDSELDVIREVWARVSQDYAVFDVDVTTEDPGTAAIDRDGTQDTTFGTRAVVTDTTKIFSSCYCGGIAYIDVFSYPYEHERYQPAFVFQQGVGDEAKQIAEAVSHEVGHNLALHHDGNDLTDYYRGHQAWAPIMGASYDRPITQWSAGEYAKANNAEDDLALIASSGLSLLPDDHGNTAATATVLQGPSVELTGVITDRSDVDRFTFTTTGGQLSLSVTPPEDGPNLDASLSLYDPNGKLLARDDPASSMDSMATANGLSAGLSMPLEAGTYGVVVDGVGYGSPSDTGYSDYASIGTYTLSGTLPEGAPAVPPAPTNVRATIAKGKVTVRWTDKATTETGYQVSRQRQYPNGTWSGSQLVSTRPGGATSATNSPWSAGKYRFLVRATSPYGSSAWAVSNIVRR